MGCLMPGLPAIPVDTITTTLDHSTLELSCLEALAEFLCRPIKDKNSLVHHSQAATNKAHSSVTRGPARAAGKRIRDFNP
jgi:hypothetical protein